MRWTPGIGDPTVMGWATLAAYFGTALFCLSAARRSTDARTVWQAISIFLVLLGINKQLDLQTWFTQVARGMATSEGWYESRRQIQWWFIAGLVGLGTFSAGLLFWRTRQRATAVRVAIAGLTLLFVFIALRASSFHHVDWFLGITIFGLRFNWVLELGGIAVIAIAASRARV